MMNLLLISLLEFGNWFFMKLHGFSRQTKVLIKCFCWFDKFLLRIKEFV